MKATIACMFTAMMAGCFLLTIGAEMQDQGKTCEDKQATPEAGRALLQTSATHHEHRHANPPSAFKPIISRLQNLRLRKLQ